MLGHEKKKKREREQAHFIWYIPLNHNLIFTLIVFGDRRPCGELGSKHLGQFLQIDTFITKIGFKKFQDDWDDDQYFFFFRTYLLTSYLSSPFPTRKKKETKKKKIKENLPKASSPWTVVIRFRLVRSTVFTVTLLAKTFSRNLSTLASSLASFLRASFWVFS